MKNNELKFRIWNGVIFIQPESYRYLIDRNGKFCCYDEKHGFWECLDHIVFQLATGLKDKTGQDIYEGDIVNGTFFEKIGVVEYEKCRFTLKTKKENYYLPGVQDIMVIGNIFENKDLLES